MGTFTNSVDPDESFINTVCIGKKIFRQKNTIFFFNYNLTPLDMYNGLYQVYCVKSISIQTKKCHLSMEGILRQNSMHTC